MLSHKTTLTTDFLRAKVLDVPCHRDKADKGIQSVLVLLCKASLYHRIRAVDHVQESGPVDGEHVYFILEPPRGIKCCVNFQN